MSALEVSKDAVEEFWGNANMISLQENTSLNGQLVLGSPVVLGNPQDHPEAVRPSPEGEPVQSTVDWVTFDGSSDSIQLIGG